MTQIYKHKHINGRPEFSVENDKRARTKESILGKNPLLNRLKPAKHSSPVRAYFKQAWKNFKQFFQVEHPNPIHENRAGTIRPLESETALTVGNLWHHYKRFITEDQDCPQGLKACFQQMEKDEKEIFKLSRTDPKKLDQKKKAFVDKIVQEIHHLPVGKTRLLLLGRKNSLDQSLSGETFCTLTRTQNGYTLHFLGLDEETIDVGGKEKVQRDLTYKDIPADFFKNDPFLKDLLTEWIEPEGVVLSKGRMQNFVDYEKKNLTLEDYTTRSLRADKLFWNIVLSIPKDANTETTRESIRGIRLRAEILTLFETFENARNDLDQNTKEYKDLKKLHQETSAKVLLYYRKGYISKEDFRDLKQKFVRIDDVLQKAKTPSKSLPSKVSLKKHVFKDIHLKNTSIQEPHEGSEPISFSGEILPNSNEVVALNIDQPVSLERYSGIDSPEAFMEHLTAIHSMENPEEILRFFHEIPFKDLVIKRAKNPDSFWWQLDKEDARKAMEMIVDLTENVLKKPAKTLTQYDFESIFQMKRCLWFLSAHTTGIAFSSHDVMYYEMDRKHRSFIRSHQLTFEEGWEKLFNKYEVNTNNITSLWFRKDGKDFRICKNGKDSDGNIPPVPIESYDLLVKQQKMLDAAWVANSHEPMSAFVEKLAFSDQWIRPIENPYLMALFIKAITGPSDDVHEGKAMSPEGYFDNPEGVFEHFAETNATLTFTPQEMKALSRLLRRTTPHTEFLSFMKEKPHLLQNRDVRNFFDALFFGKALSFDEVSWIKPDFLISSMPLQIEEEIQKLTDESIETLIYYNEMLIRLKEYYVLEKFPIDNFPDQGERLKKLCEECQNTPYFGFAARVYLRAQLQEKPIPPEKLGEILNTYADIYGSFMDPMNVEPIFEQEMQHHWEMIVSKFSDEDFTPLLNRLATNKKMPLDGSPWVNEGNFVFKNAHYEIDLKTWKIRHLEGPVIGFLPQQLAKDPQLSSENLADKQVCIETIDDSTLYSFTDSKGIPIRIEVTGDKVHFYKKFVIQGQETWLQALDMTPQPPKNTKKGWLADYKALKKALSKESSVHLFDNGLYINPKNRKKAYVIHENGSIDFEVRLKPSQEGLIANQIFDLRDSKRTGPWQVNTAVAMKNKSIECLSCFENKEEILLWSRKGLLKQVELPRYGLKFSLSHGHLECLTAPYEGYRVKLEATDVEKKGIPHALLLEHPDEKMPKKLLVPDSNALELKEKILMPKARGFGKIALVYEFVQHVRKNTLPPLVARPIPAFDASTQISHTAFDLRPFTGQICKASAKDYFQLARHASLSRQPLLAYSYLKQIPLKKVLTHPKLLQEMFEFLESDSQTGGEAALKLRLASKLLYILEDNKKLKEPVKEALENVIESTGKQILLEGRSIPGPLQLTKAERAHLASIMKVKDSDYFNNHMSPYFIKDGSLLAPPEESIIAQKIQKNLPISSSIEERIEALEAISNPNVPLADDKLIVKMNLSAHKEAILFTPQQVKGIFSLKKNALPELTLERKTDELPFETIALDEFQADLDAYKAREEALDHFYLKPRKALVNKFVENKLLPLQNKQEEIIAKHKLEVEKALRKDKKTENQMALLSGENPSKTFDELTLDLIQGKLSDDHPLKAPLIGYFDALAKSNALGMASSLIEKMQKKKIKRGKDWDLSSDELHRLLTLERRYDPEKDPRLLVFEALTFKNFKDLPGGLNQLELLESLLNHSSNLIQAPTGAGKTSVLSVLESLLKANGENLVIQKVLPPLFNQTEAQAQSVLGDLFGTLVMPLRINMKMPMTKNEIYYEDNQEKIRQISVFKGMYEELLEVMQNKGLVLTDYTSLPMLEAKFFKLGGEIIACAEKGIEPTDIQIEHYTYIRKILILLQNKGLESMDEFDQPNRPIQKIQLDLGSGSKLIPEFMFKTALEIYDLLLEDEDLGLVKNIQGDLAKETRQRAIEKAASKMAEQLGNPDLLPYFLGQNEDVLQEVDKLPKEMRDKIAFCKDQFSIYLPLTLNTNEGSRYARSNDGSKTVPCQMGEKHDAKFGTILEQINYTIQDYTQAGVTAYDVNLWLKNNADNRAVLEEEWKEMFGETAENDIPALVNIINADPIKVRQFLLLRLQNLKTSGAVISLDPINAVDISRAVSGISATMGAPDSLHKQFQVDRKAVGQIKAGMAYRIQGRAANENVLPYDPETPEEVLSDLDQSISAIIDGSGAFRKSKQQAAKMLLDSNPELKQVGYHTEGEAIVFEGTPSSNLQESGFFFSQSHTRGTDITLSANAHALLTISEKDGMRDFSQKEGRLRREGQTFQLAMPKDQAVSTVLSAMSQATCIDAATDSKDIYRHYRQVFPSIVRKAMKEQLFACEEIDDFVDLFQNETARALFITKPENAYHKPGDYYKARKHIQKEDINPQEALDELCEKYKDIAIALGLNTELDTFTYPEGVFEKMPLKVSSMQAELENELQVEEEEEMEAELEEQLELNTQNEVEEFQAKGKSDLFYPPRVQSKQKAHAHQIHVAYDAKLFVSEAFLPFERNKNSPFKRQAFEHSMFNVGEVLISFSNNQIKRAVIEDPLRDWKMMKSTSFVYDIRTEKILGFKNSENLPGRAAGQKDAILQSAEFNRLIAQIKFLDGRTSGYSDLEMHELENWLNDSDPVEMKRHFKDDILRFRYRDKNRFEKYPSQLGDLFKKMI